MAERHSVAASLRLLAQVAAVVAAAPVALWWLRLLGLVPDATAFAGIEYVPPSWLLAPLVPAVALLVIAHYRTTAGVLVFAWIAVALFRGDHALGARAAQAVEGGVDVGVLEWAVEGEETGEIAARLERLRPDVAVFANGDRPLSTLGGELRSWRLLDGGPGGATIATPHRVLSWRTVELPAEAGGRKFTHAELEVAGTRVHVLGVNLADRAPLSVLERLERGGLRLAARDAASRFLADYVHDLEGPVIVAGDLDVPPATGAIRRLAGIADDLLLADHPVGIASFGSWKAPVRTEYLFVRDLAPVRSERIGQTQAGQGLLFGVARLPGKPGSSAGPASAAVPFEG